MYKFVWSIEWLSTSVTGIAVSKMDLAILTTIDGMPGAAGTPRNS
jgi:hypothetical protein